MEIYPRVQLALLVAAFLTGLASGVLFEVLAAFRILLGAYRPPAFMRARYARPLPLLHRPVPFREGAARRAFCVAVTAVLDAIFCVVLAIAAILLLYEYNDGAVRPFALVMLLSGLAAWRVTAARFTERLTAYLAYALASLSLYVRALLLLPPRALGALVRMLIIRPLGKLVHRIRMRRMQKSSEALCREQLVLASVGLDAKQRKKEGNKDCESKEKDHHHGAFHPRAHRGRVLRGHRAHRGAFDGAQSDAPRDRGAKTRKGALGGGHRERRQGKRVRT